MICSPHSASRGWKEAMSKYPMARLRADGKEQCVGLMVGRNFVQKHKTTAKTGIFGFLKFLTGLISLNLGN